MARKLRLEFPGALYHVINRGNHQRFIFRSLGARQAFEDCLLEACERSEWLMHAFVVMGNHYHVALETPHGNLVAGMHWLQSTFANRFNRFHGERGHLFQDRFKALLVEDGTHLGTLCHYLHLNPARAKIVALAELGNYRHSSYWYLQHPHRRPKFLLCNTALRAAGQLTDTPEGRLSYEGYLACQLAEGPTGCSAAYVSMSCGWALGSQEFRRSLLEDHPVAEEIRAWETDGARQVRNGKWQLALERLLREIPAQEKTDTRGAAPWKIRTAIAMKISTDADNRWLAQQLQIASPRYLAKLVCLAQRR